MTDSLITKRCVSCEGGVPSLSDIQAKLLLKHLHADWKLNTTATEMERRVNFKNYYETMAFVNAIAWMAHQENHHPDLSVHYDHCIIRYSTHAIKGLSENDFICAAKVDQLLNPKTK